MGKKNQKNNFMTFLQYLYNKREQTLTKLNNSTEYVFSLQLLNDFFKVNIDDATFFKNCLKR